MYTSSSLEVRSNCFATCVPLQPPAASDEKVLYRNDEAQKGSVNVPVPEWFRDLSLDHKPLGCLTEGVKVTRLVFLSISLSISDLTTVYHSVYHSVYLISLQYISQYITQYV